MKASSARELAIRFVLDRHGRHHDVASLSLRDIHRQPDGRNAFRCGACFEPVGTRAGFIRQPYFAHSPIEDDTPECAWRTDIERGPFSGRNPTGDDGKWHIDAQCEIMTILEAMGCGPVRNASVRTEDGLRKPDIAVTIDNQLVHFEVQASPTDAWCAARRTDRDFRHGAVTMWIVSANAFRRALADATLPTWVETLAAMGGGQVWLWDTECYQRSLRTGRLSLLRSTIDDPAEIDVAELPIELPRIVPFCARLSQGGQLKISYPVTTAPLLKIPVNLPDLADALADEQKATAARLGHSYRYDYGLACLNTPFPTFMIFEGVQLCKLRDWFRRQSRDRLAYFYRKLSQKTPYVAGHSRGRIVIS